MIIGTAGHIDHGKSALVTALTGHQVDRLAEERRRGITIDLNFAPLELPGAAPAGIVDVPGHEDFVRTMVAGASGIDLVLLVIDLGEGPRPQTEEHLAIVEQLRIPRGIPVFTKSDLVEPDWADLVVADWMPRLMKSPVRWAEPAIVSAATGAGIESLRARLRQMMVDYHLTAAEDAFRMPIDRAFSTAGVGTVVTGTAWTGRVRIGDQILILPGERIARIRSIEAYGRSQPATTPRTRTALGLAGVERAAIRRGDVVVTGSWRETTQIDVAIDVLESAPRPLGNRARVRIHHGTAEVLARIVAPEAIAPGRAGVARLRLESPLVARGGDRFVVRSYSPVATVGGGEVLDPLPPLRVRWDAGLRSADLAARARALAGRRPWGIGDGEALQLIGPAALASMPSSDFRLFGGRWISPAVIEALEQRIRQAVKAHHQGEPSQAGISLETLRQSIGAPDGVFAGTVDGLVKRGTIRAVDGRVALSGFVPTLEGGEQAVDKVGALLAEWGLEFRSAAELAAAVGVPNVAPLVRRAMERGTAVAVDRDHYTSPGALARYREALEAIGSEGEITPAALRERLGLSRKFLIPLLEWSDRQGITRREGDARVLVKNGR